MKVQNRTRSRQKGQVLVRTVFGLGTATAGALAYLLSGVNQVEAIVLPGIVMALLIFAFAVYGRARKSREWSAAWDAYTRQEVRRDSSHVAANRETYSWAATN